MSGRVSVVVDGKRVDTWRVGADFGEHGLLHDEPRHVAGPAKKHRSHIRRKPNEDTELRDIGIAYFNLRGLFS